MKLGRMPENIDIIHSNSWHSFPFAGGAIPLLTTVLHWVHDPGARSFKTGLQSAYHETLIKYFETLSIQGANAVTAISHYTRHQVEANFPGTEIVTIPTGVDAHRFSPRVNEPADDGRFKLLYVGTPSRRKGFDLLGPIMKKLGKDYLLYHTDGEIEGGENTERIGRLSLKNLVETYNLVDAVLFPTRYEGFGYVVAEAMACGTPVVTTNISAIPELVDNDENGILCELDDVDSFVESIIRLNRDRELLRYLGRQARKKIVMEFSIDSMIDRYLVLYNKFA